MSTSPGAAEKKSTSGPLPGSLGRIAERNHEAVSPAAVAAIVAALWAAPTGLVTAIRARPSETATVFAPRPVSSLAADAAPAWICSTTDRPGACAAAACWCTGGARIAPPSGEASKRLIANWTMRMPSARAWWLRMKIAAVLIAVDPVAVDTEHLPQRLVAIEWHRPLRADQFLQDGIVAGLGQLDVLEVRLEVVARLLLPVPRIVVAPHRDTSEHLIAVPQPLPGDGAEAVPIDRAGGPDQRVDDHQVGGPIHLQPQRVLDAQLPAITHCLAPLPRPRPGARSFRDRRGGRPGATGLR